MGVQTSVCVEENVAGSCFARGARCWFVPEFWGVLPPHLFSCTCFIRHKENKGKSLPVWKNRGVQQFSGFICKYKLFIIIIFLWKKMKIN